jgi:hypothetical protein
MSDAWMFISSILATVHWVPVIGVTLLSFGIGAVWYLPFLFGRTWLREIPPDDSGRKRSKLLVYLFSVVLLLIAFTNLSLVVAGTGAFSGLLTALQISVVWIATSIATTYLITGRSWRVIAVDTSLYIVLFAVGGLTLGAF